MKRRIVRVSMLLALLLGAFALAGCSALSESEGGMGTENMKVWGYVASEDNAQLEMDDSQLGVDELVVSRVLAPEDAWIVVHLDDDGMPGERIGLERVKKGESTDVSVELGDVTTPKVIVALHADRGGKGRFDFDMMNAKTSPDRPFFVNEEELAKVVAVREFGVKAAAGEAAIEVADQKGATGTLTVDRALAPTDAWIVVHLDDDGMPGQRVGLARIPAGESRAVEVELDPLPLTDTVFAAVHADRGEAGAFEFDMMDKLASPDQPFFVDEEEVATAVLIK